MNDIPNFKVVTKDEQFIPTRAHDTDAGWDLRAYNIKAYDGEVSYTADVETQEFIEATLQPNARVLVNNGIKIALEAGWEAQIRPRSGNALKRGLMVTNSPGTIDADYRGYVGTIITNTSNIPQTIKFGDRISQMVFKPVYNVELEVVTDFDDATDRGDGGFGHTGK